MKTLEQTIKRQKAARIFWVWFLILSAALVLIPFLPLPIAAEIGFSAAFCGIVFLIVSWVMSIMYRKRQKAAENLKNPGELIGEWLVPDSFREFGGQAAPALFSKTGIFYAGHIYPAESYSCRIEKAQLGVDEGIAVLQIGYSAATRYGRRMHNLNIPIPPGKEGEAQALSVIYSKMNPPE